MKIDRGWRLSVVAMLGVAAALTITLMGSASEPAAAQQPEQRGDANCSGDTDIVDALFVALYTVELREGAPSCPIDASTEISLANADVDDDGEVTIIDALLIARCDAGIDTTPCEPQTPTTAANDQMVNATEIFPNETGYSVTRVDQHVQATIEPDENPDNCISPSRDNGSVWYRFTATTSRVSIVPENDDQYAGIFRAVDGVSNPKQMSDLALISCGEVNFDVGAIVRPGETYWVSVSGYWKQALWFFDRDPGCPAEKDSCRTRPSNDDIRYAIGIDFPGDEPVLVDDFDPGNSGANTINIDWTYTPEEIEQFQCPNGRYGVGDNEIDNPNRGSVWYEIVAPAQTLEIRGGDDQTAAIFATNTPHGPTSPSSNINSLDDLTQIACDEPEKRPLAATIPGQTYLIAIWGQSPGQPFTISAPPPPPNDELVDALRVSPSADGMFVPASGDAFRATFADDENRENCHEGNEFGQRGEGSVWYRFEATTSRVSVLTGWPAPRANGGIYAAVDGVAEPTQMADLELIACTSLFPDVSAIVQPGNTYWISIGHAETAFWIFDSDPLCVANDVITLTCPVRSNDFVANAAGIDVSGPSPILVDDFAPGPDLPGDTNTDLTYSPGELEPGTCIDPTGGSVWYRLVTPSTSLTISGSDDQRIGVYRSLSELPPVHDAVTSLRGLELVGCGTPQNAFTTDTVPGETYYLVASETYPEQIFTVGW